MQQEVYLQIKNLHRWAQILWTLVGRPAGGWAEGDEENWDRAIGIIEEEIVKSKGFYYTEEGEPRVKALVNICCC
jgi:hypothetical protein